MTALGDCQPDLVRCVGGGGGGLGGGCWGGSFLIQSGSFFLRGGKKVRRERRRFWVHPKGGGKYLTAVGEKEMEYRKKPFLQCPPG